MRSKNKELMQNMLEFIDKTYNLTGKTPSYREIAQEFSITSACVSKYINEMSEKNMLSINKGQARGIVTNKMQSKTIEILSIPVVGSVACGTPILAEENIERYIPIPKTLVGNGKFFILVANGDSMINANISNGDLVIIKQQETAEMGQIVVALINDEATLKRYYIDKKNKKIRLHPENEKMEDMFFDNIQIQGVAVKVIKDLF